MSLLRIFDHLAVLVAVVSIDTPSGPVPSAVLLNGPVFESDTAPDTIAQEAAKIVLEADQPVTVLLVPYGWVLEAVNERGLDPVELAEAMRRAGFEPLHCPPVSHQEGEA
jgi:hypothetical protein